jgi:ABC-2 type transport system permease protein
LPTDDFNPATFRLALDAGLKRFASGFTKIVALALPTVDPQMAHQKYLPTFAKLEHAIERDYSLRRETLSDGNVTPEADILVVVAAHSLDEKSVFAVDQFLMRGGTVVVATSPFSAEVGEGVLRLRETNSGLQDWLKHNGLSVEHTLVLDKRNTSFHSPVSRAAGDYEFQDLQLIDYPYFIDLRPPGLSQDHAVTSSLPQVTMAWASPITVARGSGRRISTLLRSSSESWLRSSLDVMPGIDINGISNLQPPVNDNTGQAKGFSGEQTLGVIMEGRFTSFFSGSGSQGASATRNDEDASPQLPAAEGPRAVLERSPESARIVLFSSNDFVSDKVLNSLVTASGTQYLGPLDLISNTLDWALQDEQLLDIRSRAHFNRTLPAMEREAQLIIEYLNYGLALLWLLVLGLVAWLQSILRRRRYARGLSA